MNSLAVQEYIPGKWREQLINCRNCKRSLVKFLGKCFLDITGAHLCSEQALYVAGAFDGDITDTEWFVRGGCRAQPEPALSCNAARGNGHKTVAACKTKHFTIISPDTDIYHIGLPLQCVKEKNVLIQVSPISSRSIQLVNIRELINALHHDPDLANVSQNILPHVIQTLYVVSGCDYISFFSEVGKATFLRYFFQHTSFITGGEHNLPQAPWQTRHLKETSTKVFF